MHTTIERTHTLKSHGYGVREIHGYGDYDVFKIKEYYNDKVVAFWHEDSLDRKVIKCWGRDCRVYSTEKRDFGCPPCTEKREVTRNARKIEQACSEGFQKRLLLISKELRKLYPEYKMRKGRGKTSLVFTQLYEKKDEQLENLKAICIKHQCKMNTYAYGVEGDNWSRRQVSIEDNNMWRHIHPNEFA